MKAYVSFQAFHTKININCKKCDIAALLISSQFSPMCMPKNLESAPAQVLTQLQYCNLRDIYKILNKTEKDAVSVNTKSKSSLLFLGTSQNKRILKSKEELQ